MIKPGGVIAAIAAAAIGAVVWGLIGKFTNYEIGYVAWGIGALVGFASSLLGSRGVANGLLCAALALASIAGGKVLGSMWTLESGLADSYVSREMYDEYMEDARLLSGITEEQYPQFMVDREYTAATSPADIPAEELQWFKEERVPELQAMQQEQPTFETWSAGRAEEASEQATAVAGEITLGDHVEAIKKDLGPIDALFAFLGVATAFALGKGGEQAASGGGSAAAVDYDNLRYTPPAPASGTAAEPTADTTTEPPPPDEPRPPGSP